MFAKQSLKNRFKSLESKLAEHASEKNHASEYSVKSSYPEIHSQVKASSEEEEGLNYYLRSLKKSFNRVEIKDLDQEILQLEAEFSDLVNSYAKSPCLILLTHPENAKALENFKRLMMSMREAETHWRLIFKNLNWVNVTFNDVSTVITVDQNHIEASKLEALLKNISIKSQSLVSFNMQKKDEHILVGLRLESNVLKKNFTARDTAI